MADVNVEVLRLSTDARVDDDIIADERGDARGAPNAWRLPTPLIRVHPGGCGAERERMPYPRRPRAGVTDEAVVRLQPLEPFPHRCRIGLYDFLQRADIGGEALVSPRTRR